MFLDNLALVILLAGLTLVFYTFIYIHDIPHRIAKQRHHPHEEAIHVACWLSIFTLHAIWPIVFIWAASHQKQSDTPPVAGSPDTAGRIADLEARLRTLEATKLPTPSTGVSA